MEACLNPGMVFICPLRVSTKKPLLAVPFNQAGSRSSMAMHAPPQLAVTKVFLTDNPYDKQLGLLRWIRTLLTEVVDTAASQSEDDQHRHHQKQEELPVDVCKEGDQEGCALGAPTPEDKPEEEDSTGGVTTKSESTKKVLEESRPCVQDVQADVAMSSDPSDSRIISEALEENGTAVSASSRKRPRNLTNGRELFGVGSVVECFHPDDGLWYPATITAVLPPPPPKTASAELPPRTTHSLHSDGTEGAIAITPPAPAEDGALPLPDPDSNNTTTPVAADPLTSLTEAATPGSESERGHHEGQHGGQQEGQHEGEHGGEHEGGHQREDEGQHEHLPALDVTFLGYGNSSTVPYVWAREIVTPEVLQWCKDNGIEVFGARGSLATADGDESATQVAVAVAAETSDCDGRDGSGGGDGGRGDGDGGDVEGEPSPGKANGKDPTTGGIEVVETEVEGVGVGGGGGQGGGKQARKGGKKNKNNKNRNKNNKSSKNNKNHKGKGGWQKQTLTPEEEEERFLMRCASRCKSPYPHVPNKYWGQRYRFFSRFDEGIGLDSEGWYSVTPEAIARHIAERVCFDVLVDPFVGCGGNAVQFALVCHLVFAIDIDPVKLEHARRNAAIYGVENRIEFILGDAMKVLPTLKADAVFLSPPWGGPAYQDVDVFDLHSMIPPPLSALEMFRAARAVTPNVVFFLPRNIDTAQIAGLPAAAAAAATAAPAAVSGVAAGALEAGTGTAVESATRADEGGGVGGFDETCEVELQFLNGKLKTTTAYFGSDIAAVGKTKSAKVVGEGRAAASSSSSSGDSTLVRGIVGGESGSGMGGGTEGVTDGTAAWSGRHVRFSDDGEDKVGLGSAVDWTTPAPSGKGQEVAPPPPQKRETRENALYEAWVTSATTR